MYYLDLITSYTQPIVNITVLFIEPFIMQNISIPIAYIVGASLTGVLQSLDIKFREPNSKHWKYTILNVLFGTFVLTWLLFYTLITF